MQKMRYAPEEEQLLMSQLWSPAIKDDPEVVDVTPRLENSDD